MKPEDKQLSLIDLFSRFHYGVRVMRYIERNNKIEQLSPVQDLNLRLLELYISEQEIIIKPYLRPMSSMTEEEKEELRLTYNFIYDASDSYYPFDDEDNEDDEEYNIEPHYEPSIETFDWYNKKMFDYRGLIPRGLALVAPEGMYK